MDKLITLTSISLAFGLYPLLDEIQLQITAKERVCLIGRNGAGKSSLLKIIEGKQLPDSGEIWRKPGLKIARLEQELPQTLSLTVYEFVASGLESVGRLLTDYQLATHQIGQMANPSHLKRIEELQRAIDQQDGWKLDQNINTILTRLQLPAEQPLASLSGGWQRRAALAKALVSAPDLLLLDEPTNHLDIEAIQWLENELINLNIGLLFITHDRALLQRLATRILELDRGKLTSWPGDYANFLRRKEEMLQAESKQNALFDKKLAQEEAWIRQGIKARRTRNEGRVRALKKLRLERSQRYEVQGKASFNLNEAEKSGQLVVEVKNITHSYDNQLIVKDFSMRVMRGDRIGLVGPNGVGKSTLLNILLGKLTPQQGTVKMGTKLQVAYFDQLRQTLELEKTVVDNVAQGHEFIELNGKRRHVMSYLSDFLFSPERARTPVKALSGGECNRLLLARLFTQPANLLVMDEPTNDLDIETLELLEELLANFDGTLLLVSHDRAFLDNVVTSLLAFTGGGKIQEYVGGYQDWLQYLKKMQESESIKTTVSSEKKLETKPEPVKKKLSYKEQRELIELPQKIETLEAEQAEIQQLIATAEFYQQESNTIAKTMARLQELEKILAEAYTRWDALEKLSSESAKN